jgi:hypothetical protein
MLPRSGASARWAGGQTVTFRRKHKLGILAGIAIVCGLAVWIGGATGGSSSPSRTIAPGPTPAASPSAAPVSPTPALSRYELGSGVSFYYPATWRVLAPIGDYHHYSSIGPVLGTGDWQIPCVTWVPSPAPVPGALKDCGLPAWTLPPGAVVVQFGYDSLGCCSEPIPFPGGIPLHDGIVATDEETGTASLWEMYFPPRPNEDPWTWSAEARYGAGDSTAARAQVRAMIESLRYPSVEPSPNSPADQATRSAIASSGH